MKQTMYHFPNPQGYTPLNVHLAGGSHLAYVLRRSTSCKMLTGKPYGARPFKHFRLCRTKPYGGTAPLARWLLSQVASWHTATVRFSPTNFTGASAPHLWGYRKLGYVLPWRHAKRHLLQDGGLHTYIFLS